MATRAELEEQLRRQLRMQRDAQLSPDLLYDAINDAIIRAWPNWYEFKIDSTTVCIAADTFAYTLPSGVEYIVSVELEGDSSEAWETLRDWHTFKNTSSVGALTDYLYLPNASSYEAGKYVRVSYEAKPHALASASDNTTVPTDYIIAGVRAYLAYEKMMQGPQKDTAHWEFIWRAAKQDADDIIQRSAMPHKPSDIHFTTWGRGVDIFAQPGIIDRHRPY